MRSLFLIALLAFTFVSAQPEPAKIVRRSTCSQTYTASSGVITSHPYYGQRYYDNSVDCSYTIFTGASSTVYISIDELNIERESSCSFDALTIGLYTTNSKKLCGTERGTFIYNNVQGSLVLGFKTDGSVTSRGFKITYRVSNRSCSVTYKNDFGVITSPRYGLTNEYANNLNCEYAIETGAGKADVYLVLKQFDVESASGCVWDYLDIVAPQNQYQKLCGTKSPGTTYTIRDVEYGMMLRFHSDSSITKSGFLLEYQVIRKNSSIPSLNSTSWNNTDLSGNNTIPSWNNTDPSGNNTIPSWNNTDPSGNNTIPSWNNTGPSGNNTTPSWNNTDSSGNNTIPSWNNTGSSGNNTIPSWNNTDPSGNNTIPSWNNTGSSGNNTIPSWNNTGSSGNNTIPSWNNTGSSGNNTIPSWNNTGSSGNNTIPSWNNTDASWNNTTPSWNNTDSSWNNTIPSWNNTVPSWNTTILSGNNSIPLFNNTDPITNSTISLGNNTLPSWNNTSPFGNNTFIS